MTKFLICCAIVLLLPTLTGATVAKPRQLHAPDAAFFLANNDDVMEALQSYAEALCVQDKVADDSPAAILTAGALCGDSERNADGDSLSRDGAWRGYALLAAIKITAMCAADEQVQNLCRWFR